MTSQLRAASICRAGLERSPTRSIGSCADIGISKAFVSPSWETRSRRALSNMSAPRTGEAGGDGLIQRFGLLAWPDPPSEWHDIDEYPNSAAREKAWKVFEAMAKLDTQAALRLGAQKGSLDKIPCFRFDEAAHQAFLEYRTELERTLRSGEISPALEGHLAKYRKLVPSLALINHLADGGDGPVSHRALLKALAAAHYFESHARPGGRQSHPEAHPKLRPERWVHRTRCASAGLGASN